MRAYKIIIYITAFLTVVAFVIAGLLHYLVPRAETEFWINVCLGVFGSAILTAMTSVVFYQNEKRNTLEGFAYHTRHILSFLNKYQENMSLEQKLHYFLDYDELDKSGWDRDFGNIDFFFDKSKKNRKYIYDCIYYPILKFGQAVRNHVWHFRWYLDGSGKNDAVMQKFVAELQEYLLEKCESDIPTEYDDEGNVVSSCYCSSVQPKLVHNVFNELNGHYYEIMYGKRIARRQKNSNDR